MDEAIFNQYNLFCSALNFCTKSGRTSFICSTGNCSPITPVEANIKSFVFTTSETPSFVFDSFRVKFFAKFFAKISKLSFPCFPVKVFAFLVLTHKPFTDFL